jgi:hypothetical protein
VEGATARLPLGPVVPLELPVVGAAERLAELQPAARRVPMPTAAAAVANLIERMLAVSGRRSKTAMGRAPLPHQVGSTRMTTCRPKYQVPGGAMPSQCIFPLLR